MGRVGITTFPPRVITGAGFVFFRAREVERAGFAAVFLRLSRTCAALEEMVGSVMTWPDTKCLIVLHVI